MNIKQAKQEITNTLKAYLAKDQLGNYLIPTVRQRPVLLMGPPGVGKTQIMEQIAAETGVGLVAYTITHHTRQSAIGLPFIEKRTYGGEEVSVTEYTMSEILSSVYRLMERTGLQEGILFLDEINCVSETLAPMMLQFLQCKTFGNQALPEGWTDRGGGQPAGVQQVRPGLRRGDPGPGEAHRRGGGLRRVEGVRPAGRTSTGPSSPTWTSRRTTSTASRTRRTASSLPPPGAGRILSELLYAYETLGHPGGPGGGGAVHPDAPHCQGLRQLPGDVLQVSKDLPRGGDPQRHLGEHHRAGAAGGAL